MRNLKKILALVLALVMSMSVMSVAGAEFSDFDSISGDYAEAAEILNGIGVFRGYEDGSFKPQNTITRAEVAAIIYRIDTGDVNDAQVKIYADYNRFADVDSKAWYAGYVNYCANAEYVKGYDENNFGPNDKVTGYQALAMILRAVGYDKNNEFSGSAWQIEVAKYANKLGITANVSANTLGVPATRELIAELLWRTVYTVPQVTYTPALGYNQHKDIINKNDANLNNTINEDMFLVAPFEADDVWGRPGYGWTMNTGKWNETVIVYHAYTPDFVEYKAVTECDIATVLGAVKKDQNVTLYTNGYPTTKTINRLDNNKTNENHLVGAQGTYIAVYNFNGTDNDRVILVDTYLGYVSNVQKQVTDKAGHIKVKASSNVTVFTGENDATETYEIPGNEFAKGTMLLASIYNYPVDANEDGVIDGWEKAVGYLNADEFDLRAPTAIQGKQTHIWWNAEKHTIEKADYMDNVNFYHDEAMFDKDAAWTWYFDEHNNVIGSFEISYETAKQYAVVLGTQWVNAVGQRGYALGQLQYMDGTIVEDAVIAKVNGKTMQYAGAYPTTEDPDKTFENGYAYTTLQYNVGTEAHLYEVTVNNNGSLNLTEVTKELTDVVIKKGVSKFNDLAEGDKAPDAAVYSDNETLFVYWVDTNGDYFVDSLKFVKGYHNADLATEFYPAGQMVGENVDVVYGDNNTFASIVYIANSYDVGKADAAVESFVYFTSETTCYALKNYFVVAGVYGADGEQAPLYFAPNAFGTEQETAMVLTAMVEAYRDVLVKVTTSKEYGVTLAIDPIFDTYEGGKLGNVMLAPYGTYTFLNRGVVKVGDLALNINTTTNFYNEDGEAITFTEMANLYGANLYIIYSGTTAKTIIVTPTTGSTVAGYMGQLTAKDFKSETAGLVYTIAEDATAGELTYTVDEDVCTAELDTIIANSGVVAAIEMAGDAVEVEVNFVEATDKVATYEVVLTCGDETKTIEVSFKVVEVKAEA